MNGFRTLFWGLVAGLRCSRILLGKIEGFGDGTDRGRQAMRMRASVPWCLRILLEFDRGRCLEVVGERLQYTSSCRLKYLMDSRPALRRRWMSCA